MKTIPEERRALWREICADWLGGINERRIAARLDLTQDQLEEEMAAMKTVGGYEMDPRARVGLLDPNEPSPREHANVARGKFRVLGRRGHAG